MNKLRHRFISKLRKILWGSYLSLSECEVSAETKNAEAENLHEWNNFLEIQMDITISTMQT
jgi:hypothetical protein